MSETATITIEAVAAVKTGEGKKGPWKKWAFKGDDDHWYSTFSESIGTKFEKGTRYVVEYSENSYGRTVENLDEAEPAVVAPPFGTGEYVRAKTSSDDNRAFNARKALELAATSASLIGYIEGNAPTAKTVSERVLPLATAYHRWLNKACQPPEGPPYDSDDDIPFMPTTEGVT